MDLQIKYDEDEIEEVLGVLRKVKNRKVVRKMRLILDPHLSLGKRLV